MGGEKLRLSHHVFFAAFIILFFSGSIVSLSAQSAEFSSEGAAVQESSGIDESMLILGESTSSPAPAGGASVFVMLRMVLVLALAALAIYGVVFFIKRLARPQESKDPNLKILARVPLGNDSFAAVLSVGAKAWLVGGGSGGVNLISEIDDTESLETMLIDDARREAETGSKRLIDFSSLLRGFGSSRKGKIPGNSQTEGNPLIDNLRKQRERFKGL